MVTLILQLHRCIWGILTLSWLLSLIVIAKQKS
jgi:hypothetical protein